MFNILTYYELEFTNRTLTIGKFKDDIHVLDMKSYIDRMFSNPNYSFAENPDAMLQLSDSWFVNKSAEFTLDDTPLADMYSIDKNGNITFTDEGKAIIKLVAKQVTV